MATNLYPPIISPIKSIQRGTAVSAGPITISSVNINKSFVRSFSTGSTGTVAASGATSGTYTPTGGSVGAPSGSLNNAGSFPTYSGTRTLSSGSTNLTTARYSAYFLSNTQITATGACSWEVVEYI